MSGYQRAAAKFASQQWLLLALAMLLLTGCAEDEPAVSLPAATSSPQDSPSPQSVTEAVERSYIASIDILDRADSLPTATRRQQLSVHMTDPQLTQVIDRIREMKEDNLASYGRVIPHVQHIEITGRGATLRDCQDSSEAGITNALTGEKVNRGIEDESITAHLLKSSDGLWRVTKIISHGKGC